MSGRVVTGIARRAKYLLLHLDDGTTVVAHLGMSGRLKAVAKSYRTERHDHVLFEIEGGTFVVYNDARRFGLLTVCDRAAIDSHELLRRLGPDPLGNAFGGESLADAGRRARVADQGAAP